MDTGFLHTGLDLLFPAFCYFFFSANQERPTLIPKEVETHAADARRQRDREGEGR